MVEITQSARDAAADYYAGLGFHGDAEKARNGTGFTYTAQAFAAAEQRGRIVGMREAAGISDDHYISRPDDDEELGRANAASEISHEIRARIATIETAVSIETGEGK